MSEIDYEKRKQLKQLPPDQAIDLYLAGLPPERQALVFAMWEMMVDLTQGVVRRARMHSIRNGCSRSSRS